MCFACFSLLSLSRQACGCPTVPEAKEWQAQQFQSIVREGCYLHCIRTYNAADALVMPGEPLLFHKVKHYMSGSGISPLSYDGKKAACYFAQDTGRHRLFCKY